MDDTSRRDFLKQTSLGLAASAAVHVPLAAAFRPEEADIKIGLIGCGGRGTGAVLDALGTRKGSETAS